MQQAGKTTGKKLFVYQHYYCCKDKLNKALEAAETLLKKKGVPFDADEMMVLIEAAVWEFNKAFEGTQKQLET